MRLFGLLVLVGTSLFPAVLFFSLPNVTDQVALFSQYLGTVALILMAWAQVWATRLPGVEAVFGGLDRVYVLHKWAGIVAMVTILLHDTIDADIEGTGRNSALGEIGETLGELSLYGLLILVVISVATFIPYHLWKWTHKAMGAFFVAGALHFLWIERPFDLAEPLGLYTGIFCLAGLLAYIYTLLPARLLRSHRYEVVELRQTGGATAIRMTPKGQGGLKARPGQFAVLSFDAPGLSEPHPYTLSAPVGPDGTVEVTVKALGDYTARLGRDLTTGASARIEGPFGHFTRRNGARPEVWVAGGIGITPFLAWAEALGPEQTGPVHLIWAVRSRAEAPHLERVEALAAKHPQITLNLVLSSDGQRVNAGMIAEWVADIAAAKVAFCGPAPLRRDLQAGLAAYGVTPRNFHYEEFEFRTGIGLKRLAALIAARMRGKALSMPGRKTSDA